MFSKYGTVESIRFRSGGYNDPRLQKKVNFYKNNFHPLRDSINSYLVFQEEESVTKALVENNSVIGTKHIRVDKANNNVN